MWLSDQYKAAFQWRGDEPDPEPHYGLVFLVLLPLAAGIGSVAWLGWSWPTLLLTALITLLGRKLRGAPVDPERSAR